MIRRSKTLRAWALSGLCGAAGIGLLLLAPLVGSAQGGGPKGPVPAGPVTQADIEKAREELQSLQKEVDRLRAALDQRRLETEQHEELRKELDRLRKLLEERKESPLPKILLKMTTEPKQPAPQPTGSAGGTGLSAPLERRLGELELKLETLMREVQAQHQREMDRKLDKILYDLHHHDFKTEAERRIDRLLNELNQHKTESDRKIEKLLKEVHKFEKKELDGKFDKIFRELHKLQQEGMKKEGASKETNPHPWNWSWNWHWQTNPTPRAPLPSPKDETQSISGMPIFVLPPNCVLPQYHQAAYPLQAGFMELPSMR